MVLSKIKRRIIFYCSVGVFLLSTPLIILYSLGYTISIQDKTFRQTGGIFVKTLFLPEFRVSVDGEFYKETSFISRGALVTDLGPGYHSIAISKDGYLIWTKNVLVEPQRVAEFRFVALTPSQQNHRRLATTTEDVAAARFLTHDILLENLASKSKTDILDLSQINVSTENSFLPFLVSPASVDWLDTSENILIESPHQTARWHMGSVKNGVYSEFWRVPAFFTTEDASPTSSPRIIPAEALGRVVPDPAISGGFFALDNKNTLYRGSTASSVLTPIIPNVRFFSALNSFIFFVDVNGFIASSEFDGKHVAVIDRKGFFLHADIYPQFKKAESGAFAFLDSAGGLFLQKPDSAELEYIDSPVRGMAFDEKGEKMLFWKEREIFIYWTGDQDWQPRHKAGDRVKIILWPGGEITNAQWHAGSYEHIFFTTRNGLFISDIDDRGGISVQRVADGPIFDFHYSKNDRKLRWIDTRNIWEVAL